MLYKDERKKISKQVTRLSQRMSNSTVKDAGKPSTLATG
jgi:hypothetical protein